MRDCTNQQPHPNLHIHTLKHVLTYVSVRRFTSRYKMVNSICTQTCLNFLLQQLIVSANRFSLFYLLRFCIILLSLLSFFLQFSCFLKHFPTKQSAASIFTRLPTFLYCIFMDLFHPFLQKIYVDLGSLGLSQSDNNTSTIQTANRVV